MDRCFKIHGYPTKFKNNRDKKFIAMPFNTSGDKSEFVINPFISVVQYQQLMDLLNKQSFSTSSNASGLQGT